MSDILLAPSDLRWISPYFDG